MAQSVVPEHQVGDVDDWGRDMCKKVHIYSNGDHVTFNTNVLIQIQLICFFFFRFFFVFFFVFDDEANTAFSADLLVTADIDTHFGGAFFIAKYNTTQLYV